MTDALVVMEENKNKKVTFYFELFVLPTYNHLAVAAPHKNTLRDSFDIDSGAGEYCLSTCLLAKWLTI